jgi:hypothetical protein
MLLNYNNKMIRKAIYINMSLITYTNCKFIPIIINSMFAHEENINPCFYNHVYPGSCGVVIKLKQVASGWSSSRFIEF